MDSGVSLYWRFLDSCGLINSCPFWPRHQASATALYLGKPSILKAQGQAIARCIQQFMVNRSPTGKHHMIFLDLFDTHQSFLAPRNPLLMYPHGLLKFPDGMFDKFSFWVVTMIMYQTVFIIKYYSV